MPTRPRRYVQTRPLQSWAISLAVLLASGRVLAGGPLLFLPPSPAAAAPPAPRFTVTDLGTLLGGQESAAYALNDRGQVVGWSDGGTDNSLMHQDPNLIHNHAVLWDGRKVRDLGLLKGFPFSAGYGINHNGQIVGGWDVNYHRGGGGPAGLLQNFVLRGGRMTILDNVTPPYLVYAKAINDSGEVAGTTNDSGMVPGAPPSDYRAVLWTGSNVTMLPLPAGFTKAFALALNDTGLVVGTATGKNRHHAILWRKGAALDLDAALPADSFSEATGVNSMGQVVEWGSGGAFLWQDGKKEAVEPLNRTYALTVPHSINDQGQIVGAAGYPPFHTHAFLWQKGKTYDLNGLIPADAGWILQEARAINNHGQLVGWGTHGGKKHAFLLTPMPRPRSRFVARLTAKSEQGRGSGFLR